jgi:hypothetical protein
VQKKCRLSASLLPPHPNPNPLHALTAERQAQHIGCYATKHGLPGRP